MLELEQALEHILTVVPPPAVEHLPVAEAAARVLANGVRSTVDLPPFDNSSMDGYAVRVSDLEVVASPATPVPLRVVGKVPAGSAFNGQVGRGECVRIFTGSPMPAGADAVVMQEDTRAGADAGQVLVCSRVEPWENVRRRGEDIAMGSELAQPGKVLGPAQLGLLAAAGVNRVAVGRRPVVGLLATGSELREPGQGLGPGQIFESNRAALAALIRGAGGLPKVYPVVPDEPAATREALGRAFAEANIVVTSGGVSVGELDYVKSVFVEAGGDLDFWRVAIKPGRPFVFGRLRDKFLLGLPGNPVSGFVTFLLLVRPLLLRWQGATEFRLPRHPAVLAEPIANPGNRRHFIRVRVDEAGRARSAGLQAAHALGSLARSNALVDLPPRSSRGAGESVEVLRFAWD